MRLERTEGIDLDPYSPTRVQARQASKSRTTRTRPLHWCGALYDLGAATRADRTLWYASKVPEELLARPWGELEYLEEFRVERTTRKNHCLHRCEVPSSDAGTLAG